MALPPKMEYIGKGLHYYSKTGNVYEGEWENDMRQGFGTLSVPLDADDHASESPKQNSKSDHTSSGIADSIFNDSTSSGGHKKPDSDDINDHYMAQLRKLYAGAWYNDNRHGVGTQFYKDGSVYDGRWENNMKEGWGRMMYADGSVYEGEWHRENRHGQGILLTS